jgi:hypothetical protein
MSFPPYPEKYQTYANTGYQHFWGRGFPYIKDDFVGGYSGLQYPSDDENKVRQKPVMDLQNIAGRGRGTGRPKKKGKGFLSDMLGTVGSVLGTIGKPIFESVPALKPFEGLLGDNSLYGLASQGLKHIGLGKKRGGRKMLSEDDPRYEPDVRIQPYKYSLSDRSPPHDIPRSRIRKRSKSVESMEGEGADPELLRAVHRYRKENKVSLAEAWAKVKEEMNFEKKVRQTTGAKRGRPKKVKKEVIPKDMRGTRKKKVIKPKDMRGTRNVNRALKKVKASDVMKYKHKAGVSLKQAWADLRDSDEV